MSSVELVDLINSMRGETAAVLRHADFMVKLEKHPGIDSTKFFGEYKDTTGRTLKCYRLPKRECELMVMSESLAVQAKVYDRLQELEVLSGAGKRVAGRIENSPQMEAAKLFRPLFGIARLIGCDKSAAAISANQAVRKVTGQNLLALMDQTHIVAENQESLYFTPTQIGAEMSISNRKVNELLAQRGLQSKQGEAWIVSDAGRQYSRIYDTGKKHGSGVPVQQIKWTRDVIPVLKK
jgi:hypothetical protein